MTERKPLHLGQVVIINDIEQPCSRMASVIVAIEGDYVRTKYLADLNEFIYWNTTGALNRYDLVTPIDDFGVRLRVNEDQYWCVRVGESVATYPDGKKRFWQEHSGPLRWKFRPSAMQLVSMTGVERTQAAPVADAPCATDMSLAFANAATLAFPVRLVTSARLPDGEWIEDFWRDVVLPMPPFIGMLLNLDEDGSMREVKSIQWVEKSRRLHVALEVEDLTGVLEITEDAWLSEGWHKDGLWA